LKITTKGYIDSIKLNIKHNGIANEEDNFRQPVFWQAPVLVAQLSCWMLVKSGKLRYAREEKLPRQAHPFFSVIGAGAT
jgi:hypothetical protein